MCVTVWASVTERRRPNKSRFLPDSCFWRPRSWRSGRREVHYGQSIKEPELDRPRIVTLSNCTSVLRLYVVFFFNFFSWGACPLTPYQDTGHCYSRFYLLHLEIFCSWGCKSPDSPCKSLNNVNLDPTSLQSQDFYFFKIFPGVHAPDLLVRHLTLLTFSLLMVLLRNHCTPPRGTDGRLAVTLCLTVHSPMTYQNNRKIAGSSKV